MKMNIKIWITGLALAAGLGTAAAQDTYQGGRLINAPFFDAGHRLLFSQHDFTFGTSRSAALGGAFTSLGADLSSMNINPAGLGMYQSSDIGFTQALSIDGVSTASKYMPAGTLTSSGNRISYGLNNVGFAYNLFNSSNTVTSVTVGFSYNRAANFNSRTKFSTRGENATIGDMFSRQLDLMTAQGVPSSAFNSDANPWTNPDILLPEWGAVLGWQTWVVDQMDDGSYGFYKSDNSSFESVTKGGIYEYNISVGANISNKLYLGATLGLTDINFSESTYYNERYAPGIELGNLWFDQNTKIQGSGLTAKLGLVARPVEEVRIGVAFHLPTYYTLEKSYTGYMETLKAFSDTGAPLMDELKMNTAPRLLAGISGVIADRAIVALDWDMAWYNKIAMRGLSAREISDSKAEAERLYKPAHTFRAGIEYLLTTDVSLRAGGAYMMDFMKDDFIVDNPTVRNGYSVTAGIGFSLGNNSYLDAAYVYNRARMTDYQMYMFDDGTIFTAPYDVVNGGDRPRTYTPTRNRHMITLTLGSRF